MNKMPLYFFAYFDFDVIKTSFNSLAEQLDNIDIIVIENKSPDTEEKIKPFFLSLLKQGKIKRYYLFSNNLANNAVEIVLSRELGEIEKHKYFFFTDGDLLIKDNANWLKEQVNILDKNPDVFTCGITLSKENLPLNNFPEAVKWIPADIAEHDLYYETRTGAHLLIFRGTDFAKYWEFREANKLNFVDSTMHNFCHNVYQKKWARTKKSEAIHLTWDSYADLNHPYTKQKLSKSLKNTWQSKNYWSIIYLYSTGNTPRVFVDWKRYLGKQVFSKQISLLKKIKKRISA